MQSYFSPVPAVASMTPLEAKVRRAEVKMTATMVKHNVPIAFAEHLSPLLREIFTDSEIAKAYSSGKTKTACILNRALKPYYLGQVVQLMESRPLSISIDGSNDKGREKMNPMTVHVFDGISVKHKFLDMCTTSGQGAGTAEVIFSKMDAVLLRHNVSWKNCVCLSVDNTSVNLGTRNSLRSRILQKSIQVYISGCPCHILHNMSSKAAAALAQTTGFDVEDLVVNVTYWFDKSTKRKAGLEEFCVFCDTAYKDVVSHVSTRWLSLEQAIIRILQLFVSLFIYFKSNNEPQARFDRLQKKFSDPMTEIYLLFFQAAITFVYTIQQMLQRDDPVIYLLHSEMKAFMKNLISRFVPNIRWMLEMILKKSTTMIVPGSWMIVSYTWACSLEADNEHC